MAFSGSCRSIRLEGNAILVAECGTLDGSYIERRLDLDGCLGNSDGSFDIGGNEFVGSAKKIRLAGTKLRAKLRDLTGVHRNAIVDLDYFVANVNGQLRPIRPGSGCTVCRFFFQDFQGTISLAELQGDDRQPGCLRCELLEKSILQYCPTRPIIGDDAEANDPIIDGESGNVNVRGEEADDCEAVDEEWEDDDDAAVHRSVSAHGLGSSQLYVTFGNGGLVSRRYQLHSTRSNKSMLFDMVPHASALSGDAQSSASLERLEGELAHCYTKHDRCRARLASALPRRIIDVGSDTQPPRVHVSEGDVGTYTCLSHCWGDSSTLKATTESITSLQDRIPWAKLGKTYQDAITYCRKLGIQYVWIDSLCILQDSLEDWNLEAPKMASYYGGCHICLAATASANHTGGCRVRTETPMAFEGLGFDGKRYSVALRPEIPALTNPGRFPQQHFFPLLTRGWVFQERRLAPRVLHFGPAELVLECNTTQVCECGCAREAVAASTTKAAMQRSIIAYTTREFQVQVEREWHRMVETYSALKLTFPSDRLPAFAGAAAETRSRREYNGVTPGEYLHGLWEKTFANDLLWTVVLGDEHLPIINESAPSWSWASVMRAVRYPVHHYDESLCAFDMAEHGRPVAGRLLLSSASSSTVMVRLKHGLRQAQFEQRGWPITCESVLAYAADDDRYSRHLMALETGVNGAAAVYLMPIARRSKDGAIAWLALGQEEVGFQDGPRLFRRIGRLDDTFVLEVPGTEPSDVTTILLA